MVEGEYNSEIFPARRARRYIHSSLYYSVTNLYGNYILCQGFWRGNSIVNEIVGGMGIEENSD